jgi:hypothetical protein
MKLFEFVDKSGGYGWGVLNLDDDGKYSISYYSCGSIDCCEDCYEGSKRISDEEALYIFEECTSREDREEYKLFLQSLRKKVYKERYKK